MEWFFDGLGTLLIGLLVGGTGGGFVAWRLTLSHTSQKQRAGDNASQVQAGRDVRRK
jgi:hypothetical protein